MNELDGASRSRFVEQVADPPLLREAWYRVQRGGKSPGVDGVTVDAFRGGVERRLDRLRAQLLDGTYRPSPVKRVEIPKPAGGWRLLGVPTIADRIVQGAAALVLQDRVTALFSDRSFAYRPFLGARRAALFLRTRLRAGAWAVTADIEKFFDNVDHQILGNQLRAASIDEDGIRLITRWLTAPIADRGRQFRAVKGLPQGAPVSPVLANLYLSGFDLALETEGLSHVRYADDFVVLAPDEAAVERALRFVATFLEARLRLHIKPAKTHFVPAAAGVLFVGYRFTPTEWTIPDAAVERFRDVVTTILERPPDAALVEVAKVHNDLVRGWRNYYGGNSVEMDRQLAELDAWRQETCDAFLDKRGAQAASAGWFDRLLPPTTVSAPEGSYEAPADRCVEEPEERDEWHLRDQLAGAFRCQAVSARAIRDAEIGRQQSPELLAGGCLRVSTHGAYVALSKGLIVVRRKKQVIFECSVADVRSVSIEGEGVVVSATIIAECARREIGLVFTRPSGRPVAHVIAVRSAASAILARRQAVAHAGRRGCALAHALVDAKLANQAALLRYHAKYGGRAESVRRVLTTAAATIAAERATLASTASLPLRKARTPMFLMEANAATAYWTAFRQLVPDDLGCVRRTHKGAADVVNMALNYGYGVLASQVWTAVIRAGLHPSLGLLHTGRRRSPGLVLDLIEPFRQPVVDRAVLALIGRGAKLEMNASKQLTFRTRRLLLRAMDARLAASSNRRPRLADEVRSCGVRFRRALVDTSTTFAPYRMTW